MILNFVGRFAKCRQMGMTHTTLEIQSYPETPSLSSLPAASSAGGGHDNAYLSVKHTTTSSLSPIIEEPSGYSSDCFEYETVHQPYCNNGRI